MIKVAFQGESGAYSEEAAYKFFKGNNIQTVPCFSFKEVVDLVQDGKVDFGILPIENSVAGSITQSYDLMFTSSLHVYGEVTIKVSHNLISIPSANMSTIKNVISHPQALAQCENYLRRKGLKAIPEFDTAGSAKKIKEMNSPEYACIASKRSAEIYGLNTIDESIEDFAWNYTRFFILSKDEPEKADYNKTSIVFSTRHKPGALLECLQAFAKRGINLTKIESRPDKNTLWHYVFYLDFEGHISDKNVEDALIELLKIATFVKVIGSYPGEKR